MEENYYDSSSSSLYDSSYTYTTGSFDSSDAAVAGFMAAMGIGFFIFMFFLFIALYVYSGITLGKIFKKAGEPSWAAWIPIYNMWKMLELGSFHGALVLITLIPVVGPLVVSILTIIAAYRIGLKFGKSGEFVLLYIFLAPVWLGMLAFGKSEWQGGTPTTPANVADQQPIPQPYQAMQPEQTAQTIEPEQPVQPMQSMQPVQPIETIQPTQSEPEQPTVATDQQMNDSSDNQQA